jgi:hypothetical protein
MAKTSMVGGGYYYIVNPIRPEYCLRRYDEIQSRSVNKKWSKVPEHKGNSSLNFRTPSITILSIPIKQAMCQAKNLTDFEI